MLFGSEQEGPIEGRPIEERLVASGNVYKTDLKSLTQIIKCSAVKI
jgi:hypothetical protein